VFRRRRDRGAIVEACAVAGRVRWASAVAAPPRLRGGGAEPGAGPQPGPDGASRTKRARPGPPEMIWRGVRYAEAGRVWDGADVQGTLTEPTAWCCTVPCAEVMRES